MKREFELVTEPKRELVFECRDCHRKTSHSVVANYKETGSDPHGPGWSFDWHTDHQITQCLGCKAITFRVAATNSEEYIHDDNGDLQWLVDLKFYPPRRAGLKALDVSLLPNEVQNIYKETSLAIESEQRVLAAIGIRALLETICYDVGIKKGNLAEKINQLQEKGIATAASIKTLHELRLLGNAAAHQMERHSVAKLTLALEILAHMLDGTYILPDKVAKAFPVRDKPPLEE
jgi:hypothetical protein